MSRLGKACMKLILRSPLRGTLDNGLRVLVRGGLPSL